MIHCKVCHNTLHFILFDIFRLYILCKDIYVNVCSFEDKFLDVFEVFNPLGSFSNDQLLGFFNQTNWTLGFRCNFVGFGWQLFGTYWWLVFNAFDLAYKFDHCLKMYNVIHDVLNIEVVKEADQVPLFNPLVFKGCHELFFVNASLPAIHHFLERFSDGLIDRARNLAQGLVDMVTALLCVLLTDPWNKTRDLDLFFISSSNRLEKCQELCLWNIAALVSVGFHNVHFWHNLLLEQM